MAAAYISTAEAATLLGVSRRRVQRLAQQGRLAAIPMGQRTIAISRASVLAFEPEPEGWPKGRKRRKSP